MAEGTGLLNRRSVINATEGSNPSLSALDNVRKQVFEHVAQRNADSVVIYNLTVAVFALFLLSPSFALAHQPRITNSRVTTVLNPEVSKAYYGTLTGEPDVYVIHATSAFHLFVEVLVPDIPGQSKDVSAVVLKDGEQVAVLDGATSTWKQFFEKFGHDTYWQGPKYKAHEEAGFYQIRVFSSNNDSKYSLAIGETEAFDGKEGLNALMLIPQIKKNFFNKSPIDFILSPLGWGLIVIMYLLSGIVGLSYRALLKRFAKRSPRGAHKNIGKPDRWLRFALGAALLLLAITTTWSPILIFFSGFALFEAIFSWCGFYAAMGKNTCVTS